MIRIVFLIFSVFVSSLHTQTTTAVPSPTTTENKVMEEISDARIRMLRSQSDNRRSLYQSEEEFETRKTDGIIELLLQDRDAIVYPAIVVRERSGHNTLFMDTRRGLDSRDFLNSEVAKNLALSPESEWKQ